MNRKKDDLKPNVQQTPLAEILAHIADIAQPLSNAELGELSDLSTDEARQFEETWSLLDTERKQQILSRLEELTEDNVELNFDRIYRNAIYDVDDDVRREAVEGLWESCDPSILRPLLRMVQQDPAAEVRSAAATALGRFAMLAEHQKLSDENRRRISLTLLEIIHNNDEPVEIRRRALEAISPLSLPEVTQAIWEAYRREETGLRISSVYAMGRNCDTLWMPTVLNEMGSEDPEMRYEAATAAGEMGEGEAVPRLIELTIDADMEVKLAAIMALGKIGGQEAKQRLRALITNKSKAVHDAAEQALSEIEAYEEPTGQRMHDFDETDAD
jgi:HEAT repeat protein